MGARGCSLDIVVRRWDGRFYFPNRNRYIHECHGSTMPKHMCTSSHLCPRRCFGLTRRCVFLQLVRWGSISPIPSWTACTRADTCELSRSSAWGYKWLLVHMCFGRGSTPLRKYCVIGLFMGCPMVVPWLSHGCPMVVPWDNLWDNLWDNHGTTYGTTYGTTLKYCIFLGIPQDGSQKRKKSKEFSFLKATLWYT